MGRGKQHGICHLCGMVGPLSFEHVPPESAFNDRKVVYNRMEQWFQPGRWSGRGRISQRGAGAYTLCEPCNNNTGAWYGKEYALWAQRVFELLDQLPRHFGEGEITVTQRYPLRFLKQAVTMFFSANSPEFAPRHPELVRFVLDRNQTVLPPQYDVYLTLVRGNHARSVGLAVRHSDRSGMEILTEVAHPPFALVLTIDSLRHDDVGRISHFGESGYDTLRDVRIRVSTGEIYSPYPGDYRPKDAFSATSQ